MWGVLTGLRRAVAGGIDWLSQGWRGVLTGVRRAVAGGIDWLSQCGQFGSVGGLAVGSLAVWAVWQWAVWRCGQ